jgi:hypothetical protein
MNTLKVSKETPRELGSYALDIGKGAVKSFFNWLDREADGALVEEPLSTANWPSSYFAKEDIDVLVRAIHEVQKRELLANET